MCWHLINSVASNSVNPFVPVSVPFPHVPVAGDFTNAEPFQTLRDEFTSIVELSPQYKSVISTVWESVVFVVYYEVILLSPIAPDVTCAKIPVNWLFESKTFE